MAEVLSRGRKALLVMGMHRSGTSAMARILSLLGARLPRDIMPAHDSNPTGHWEPMPIVDLNDKMLGEVDVRWDSPFGPERNRKGRLPLDKFKPAARDILRDQYGDDDLIVFKDPRVSLLADFWMTVLEEQGISPLPILMVRRPEEVAASLNRRNGMAAVHAQILWCTYMLEAERHSRSRPRVFCAYDQLVEEPHVVINALEDALGLDLPRRSWISAHAVSEFIRPDQRHHGQQLGTRRAPLLAPVTRLADLLMNVACGAALENDIIAETARWLRDLDVLVSPMLAALESRRMVELSEEKEAQVRLAQVLDFRSQQLLVAEGVGAARQSEIDCREKTIAELHERVAKLEAKLAVFTHSLEASD